MGETRYFMDGPSARRCPTLDPDESHDHADQAPRSGPLPRALVAVSTLLTTLAPFWSLPVTEPSGVVVRRALPPACPTTEESHDHHRTRCDAATAVGIDPRGPAAHRRHHRPSCSSRSCCCPARGPRCCRRPGRAVRHRRGPAACSTRRTRGCSGPLVRPRLAAPGRARGPGAAAVRPGRRSGVRARRPRRLRRRRAPSSARSPSASPWPRPCSTRSSGSAWAARCTCCQAHRAG